MKNAKKYIKLYYEKSQENFEKWGYYYPPRNWDEFLAWEKRGFEKHLKGEEQYKKHVEGRSGSPYIKPKRYLAILDSINDFGYLCAFEKMDFRDLNNVIFQKSRHKLLYYGMLAGGADYAVNFLKVLASYACNSFEVTKYFLPENLPQGKGTYYTEVCVNLLKIMYYGQEEFAESALAKADKFLQKKVTTFEVHFVKSCVAIYKRDLEGINEALQELCKAYQRQGYPVDKLDKCFAEEIHGLYRFIRIIDEDFFNRVEMPKHDCFFKEFEIWQKENNYPKGEMFYEYPSEMDYLNKIFQAEIPTVTTKAYRKGHYATVADDFAHKLAENVEKVK